MSVQPKVRWSAVIVALLCIAVIAGVLLASKPQRFPSITLKDGQVIELLGTTFGTEHKLKNPRIREILHQLAPNQIKKMLGPNFTASFTFGGDGLGLWLMCFDPVTKQYTSPNHRIIAIDKHGCEFEGAGSGGTGDGYYNATVYNFRAFPRRQKNFTVQISKDVNGTYEKIGEIILENPALAPTEVWTPEPLPLTRTNGPVSVRLNSYETGVGPNLVILENGKVTPKWELRDAEYEDASGNRGPGLCRMEAAWKYRGNLFQNHYGTFASNEIWTLSSISLPPSGTLIASTSTNRLSDAVVKILYLGGPGSYVLSNDVCTTATPWTPGMSHQVSSTGSGGPGSPSRNHRISLANPFVVVEHPYLGSEREMMLRVRKGERIIATGRRSAGLDGRWFYELSTILPEKPWDTNIIDLDLILQKARPVEFLVAPRRTAETSGKEEIE